MAWNVAPGGFNPGTGTEVINFGMSGITNLDIEYAPSTGYKFSIGRVAGGNQFSIPDITSNVIVNKALQIKNTAGTVVFDATWVSFSGTSATFTKNVNSIGVVTCLFKLGNV